VREPSDNNVQDIAYTLWSRSLQPGDVTRLQELPAADALYERALRDRVLLADATASAALVNFMRVDPGKWCGLAPPLFDNPEVADTMFEVFDEALRTPYGSVYALPFRLPVHGLLRLLSTKRELLLRKSRTWVGIWRSGIPEGLEFVRDAIADAPPIKLQLLFMGPYSYPFVVTIAMLDALVPVLGRLPQEETDALAGLALTNGYREWTRQHLVGRVSELERWNWSLGDDWIPDALQKCSWLYEKDPDKLRATRAYMDLLRLDLQRDGGYPLRLIREWLGAEPKAPRIALASKMLLNNGQGTDLTWWRAMEPSTSEGYPEWAAAFWTLQRRCWQES
jgi:hypothetical protein